MTLLSRHVPSGMTVPGYSRGHWREMQQNSQMYFSRIWSFCQSNYILVGRHIKWEFVSILADLSTSLCNILLGEYHLSLYQSIGNLPVQSAQIWCMDNDVMCFDQSTEEYHAMWQLININEQPVCAGWMSVPMWRPRDQPELRPATKPTGYRMRNMASTRSSRWRKVIINYKSDLRYIVECWNAQQWQWYTRVYAL